MNSFGRIFKINIYGESHGKSIGVIIDGCPVGISINEDDFTFDLNRRKSSLLKKGTTKRIETDKPNILSGIFNNKSSGSPINILFNNDNIVSTDYDKFKNIPRPGHSDFVAKMKYAGFNDYCGGGHFSGRLTLGLVAAGVIAKKIINDIEIKAELIQIGKNRDKDSFDQTLDDAISKKDSIGAIIECKIKNIPVGLGEPFFDSIESLISHMIFSIPGIKGIEFGSGFNSVHMYGSENNDSIIDVSGTTKTNNSGGINGGISNGNEIVLRVAVKPTSSISTEQETLNFATKELENLKITGRHDSCFALRVPVIIEAVCAIVLTDLKLISKLLSKS